VIVQGSEDEQGDHAMIYEVILQRGNTLVRRVRLEPGEALHWHRDPYHRVTVVLSGDVLAIEDRAGNELQRFAVTPGEVDWDEPTEQVHRGVNVGSQPYEEVVIFFLDRPDADPQPAAE
jgi:quercetin dioxygenase-like cupin family protein